MAQQPYDDARARAVREAREKHYRDAVNAQTGAGEAIAAYGRAQRRLTWMVIAILVAAVVAFLAWWPTTALLLVTFGLLLWVGKVSERRPVVAAPPRPPSAHVSMMTLRIRHPASGRDETVDLGLFGGGELASVFLGRDPGAVTVVLDDPSIAPVHAQVLVGAGHYGIKALAPGVRCFGVELAVGDGRRVDTREFEVGPFVLQYGERPYEPPPAAPPSSDETA